MKLPLVHVKLFIAYQKKNLVFRSINFIFSSKAKYVLVISHMCCRSFSVNVFVIVPAAALLKLRHLVSKMAKKIFHIRKNMFRTNSVFLDNIFRRIRKYHFMPGLFCICFHKQTYLLSTNVFFVLLIISTEICHKTRRCEISKYICTTPPSGGQGSVLNTNEVIEELHDKYCHINAGVFQADCSYQSYN